MPDRRHPSAAFWLTVALIVVLVGYPLSFGPACWITSWTGSGTELLVRAYHPILCAHCWAFSHAHGRVADGIHRYARLGARPGWVIGWTLVPGGWRFNWEYVRRYESLY